MSCGRQSPAMCKPRAFSSLLAALALHTFVVSLVAAQRSSGGSRWQTLNGNPPLVVASGGFSGLFPDSSMAAYILAMLTSVPDVVLWCNVQLTKDGEGICAPKVNIDNSTAVGEIFKGQEKTYLVNGVPTKGYFSVDYTMNELTNVYLTQGIYYRTNKFDGNGFRIVTVDEVAAQMKQQGFWLNIQHDLFFTQHNLSMTNYVLSVSRTVVVNYISSPEVGFLRSIASHFNPRITKLVFRFLGQSDVEPSTNQTYDSLLKNLTFIKTFASGILIPKDYIWPVDANYIQPNTPIVLNAHKEGLEVFASDFSSDSALSYNYSYDPASEYLFYIDNGKFSVDGVLSEFPITPSIARDCLSHLRKNASKKVDLLVISKNGASGDYPGCTDLAYRKAVSDGVDIIDCPVQMSKDGIPFCLGSINLVESTNVLSTEFTTLTTTVPEFKPPSGIFSFSLTWSQIQENLTPMISNPYSKSDLLRNPKFKEAGNFLTLSDFLALAKNSSSLSGVLISIEHAAYLIEKHNLRVTDAVLDTLSKSGYDNKTSIKVMIQSTSSSVLKNFTEKTNYELVYKVDEDIRDATDATIDDIKKFAKSVVVSKTSVFPQTQAFITGQTNTVARLQSFKLSVYVETFRNEFISQPYDFFSDATVEINSFVEGAGVNGVITEFPWTSNRYRRNRCLRSKNPPNYMSPVEPGSLMQLVTTPYMPPAEAPNPVLTEKDVEEPPLPSYEAPSPDASRGGTLAPTPPNGQPRTTACLFLPKLALLLSPLLLFLKL